MDIEDITQERGLRYGLLILSLQLRNATNHADATDTDRELLVAARLMVSRVISLQEVRGAEDRVDKLANIFGASVEFPTVRRVADEASHG